ncbi:AEC family transporter [Luedemannella helvata]|uniref:AEC family transporter n=1 Tax=Luedemannella helvata TaxID=349315 RepID=A0ABP4WXQ5_9ACTN
MSPDLLLKLVAIFVVIAIGFAAGRARVVGPTAADTLSAATFTIFAPALLFRTMAGIELADLPWRMLAVYFVPTVLLLLGCYAWQRWRGVDAVGSVVRGLAVTFSNMVQLGIPLMAALFGTAGLTLHIALISLHALILLTMATVLAEVNRDGPVRARIGQTVRRSVIHPVTLPILLGLGYSATGLPLPALADDVLATLGIAVVPLSLVTIGLSLAQYGLRDSGRTAAGLALTKLVTHPLLVLAAAWLVGLHGLPLTVAVLCAALPTGANVLLFAGRYGARQAEATATIVLATVAFAATVTAWLFVLI